MPPSQVFPRSTWREEFTTARDLGFDAIEWLFDAPEHEANPLWSAGGRQSMRELATGSGVSVDSVCAHCFVQKSLFEGAEAFSLLCRLLECSRQAGISRVIVPLLEASSLGADPTVPQAFQVLKSAAAEAEARGISILLETDLAAGPLAELVQGLGSRAIRVCYDVGNAAAAGHDPCSDLRRLLPWTAEIHIKDRPKGGPGRFLGEGDVPFGNLFRDLWRVRYTGPFVLETPVGRNAEETARRHLAFVKDGLRSAAAEAGIP
ncbi:MAG: sugar phosphate isomerase/epimerase [Planctomycetes bacterium]|nr:sugar phosphate isomerase/epimerase [Planctomycetota bacterium]